MGINHFNCYLISIQISKWSSLLSLQKFLGRVLFLHHTEWTFHESVNTDEHRACDNVRVVRDRPIF